MKTFDTPGPITVDVELGVGDLRIDATDRADTTVEVRPSDPARRATSRPPSRRAWTTRTAPGGPDAEGLAASGGRVEHRVGRRVDRPPHRIDASAGGRVATCGPAASATSGSRPGPATSRSTRSEPWSSRPAWGTSGSTGSRAGRGHQRLGQRADRPDRRSGHRQELQRGHLDRRGRGEARVSAANGTSRSTSRRRGRGEDRERGRSPRRGRARRRRRPTASGPWRSAIRDGTAAWLDLHELRQRRERPGRLGHRPGPARVSRSTPARPTATSSIAPRRRRRKEGLS